MAKLNVNPTRMELTNLKRKLQTARKGHKLLKDKNDELMRQFMILIRENKALRRSIESRLNEVNAHTTLARSVMTDEELNTALLVPMQSVEVDVTEKNVMSVRIPQFKTKYSSLNEDSTAKSNAQCYGFAFTSTDLDKPIETLGNMLPELMKLAEVEKSCQLMAAEIEKTRRRVNALEHVMIPQYEETIKYITMKLDENERSSTTRLMKVKDMMLEEKHHYKQT